MFCSILIIDWWTHCCRGCGFIQVDRGNLGDEDELILHQMILAQEVSAAIQTSSSSSSSRCFLQSLHSSVLCHASALNDGSRCAALCVCVVGMQGHVPSIVAMADLFYFGARGLPRDQAQALRYFEQAITLGDPTG